MLDLPSFTETIFVLIVSQPFIHLIKLAKLALLHNEADYQSISSCKLTHNKDLIGTTKKFDVDASKNVLV